MKTFDLGAVTAYALAVKNGFEGTVEEWLESLVPKISVGTVETGEPGSDVVVTMDGNAKTPVLNFRIPRGKPGAVTTVNGMPPDENGNVQVETSSQSDWNAAEGEPGHVLNRTHWTEGRGKVEILPECQPTYIPDDRMFLLEFASTLSNLVAGETYIVNWNGVEYPSVAVDGAELGEPGGKALGDLYTASGGEIGTAATGEPFVMTVNPGEGVMIVPFDGTTELTLSIYQSGEIVHKLDNKYLDLDWLPTKTEGDEVFLPETTITFENGVCYMQALGAFVPGDKYTIVLDGEKHSFVAIEDTETDTAFQYVGNRGLGGGEDTGEPYYFCTMQNDDGYVMSLMVADKFSGDKTVAINHFTTKYNKLPKHFLPDSVGFVTANIVISSRLNSATVDVPYAALVAAHKAGKFIRGVATVENYSDNAEFVFYLNALDAEKVGLADLGCTMNLYIYADGTVSLIAGQN